MAISRHSTKAVKNRKRRYRRKKKQRQRKVDKIIEQVSAMSLRSMPLIKNMHPLGNSSPIEKDVPALRRIQETGHNSSPSFLDNPFSDYGRNSLTLWRPPEQAVVNYKPSTYSSYSSPHYQRSESSVKPISHSAIASCSMEYTLQLGKSFSNTLPQRLKRPIVPIIYPTFGYAELGKERLSSPIPKVGSNGIALTVPEPMRNHHQPTIEPVRRWLPSFSVSLLPPAAPVAIASSKAAATPSTVMPIAPQDDNYATKYKLPPYTCIICSASMHPGSTSAVGPRAAALPAAAQTAAQADEFTLKESDQYICLECLPASVAAARPKAVATPATVCPIVLQDDNYATKREIPPSTCTRCAASMHSGSISAVEPIATAMSIVAETVDQGDEFSLEDSYKCDCEEYLPLPVQVAIDRPKAAATSGTLVPVVAQDVNWAVRCKFLPNTCTKCAASMHPASISAAKSEAAALPTAEEPRVVQFNCIRCEMDSLSISDISEYFLKKHWPDFDDFFIEFKKKQLSLSGSEPSDPVIPTNPRLAQEIAAQPEQAIVEISGALQRQRSDTEYLFSLLPGDA